MATNPTALSFNGFSRYAKLPAVTSIRGLGTFSFLAWVKVGPTSNSQFKRAFVERQGTGTGIRFAFTPFQGKLRFELSLKDGVQDTNYDYNYNWDDRWHHVGFVARMSGSNPAYDIFLDGIRVANGSIVRPPETTEISDTAPRFSGMYMGNHSLHSSGGEVFPADRYWDGKIDDILILNQSVSQGQVLDHVNSHDHWDFEDDPEREGVVAYWRLREGTGEGTGPSSTGSFKGGHQATLHSTNGVLTGALWTIDRPFLGNGERDETPPNAPTVPATPTTNIGPHGFDAKWNSTTDNVYVQYYELQVSQFSSFTSYTSFEMGRTLNKKVTGLLPATNYYWRVRAFDAALNGSGYSPTQSLTTQTVGDVTPPLPPLNLTASLMTHSSFQLTWEASPSEDAVGYKLDISPDPAFGTFLESYRNNDVGNITSLFIFGTQPLTTYYIRMRAYDMAQNESPESQVLVIQTPRLPDVTPPMVIEGTIPTSITSTAFTANWNEGIDDVGVEGYLIDVSQTDDFAEFTEHIDRDHPRYQNLDVGNVLSYRVEGLIPENGYYYRVRAYDASGNVSANTTTPTFVETTSPSIEEGGFSSQHHETNADAYTDLGDASANFGDSDELLVSGDGSNAVQRAYMFFDLNSVIGSIETAMLRVFVKEASSANFTIRIAPVSFDESTINNNTRPTMSGGTLTFSPLNEDEWVEVDVSSLVNDGPNEYTVEITTTANTSAVFSSREGENPPILYVENNPTTALQVMDMHFHDHYGIRQNWVLNPDFEVNANNWLVWSSSGTGIVLDRTSNHAHTHQWSLRAAFDNSAQAKYINTDPAPTTVGEWWTFTLYMRADQTRLLRLMISDRDDEWSHLAEAQSPLFEVTNEWRRYTFSYKTTHPDTTFVMPSIIYAQAQTATVYIDTVLFENVAWSGATFSGATSGGWWQGNAHASYSRMGSAELHVDTSFIGDSNENATVTALFRPTALLDWIYLPQVQGTVDLDHSIRRTESLMGYSYGPYNWIKNPSGEANTVGWSTQGGASVQTSDLVANQGTKSFEVQTLAVANSGIRSHTIPAAAGDVWTAQAEVHANAGEEIIVQIHALNSAGAHIGESPETLTSYIIGNEDWQRPYVTWVTPANTVAVYMTITTRTALATTFYADAAMMQPLSALNPYIDGDIEGGVWEAAPHNSYTSFQFLPEVSYDFLHVYTDPDGVVGADGDTIDFGETHVTAPIPDNTLTVMGLNITPNTRELLVEIPYMGDDNEDATVQLQWRRTDLSTWNNVLSSFHRHDKVVRARIVNLRPGTEYTVRGIFDDPDGVYGTVGKIITNSSATTMAEGTPEGAPRISFDGFVLMGREDGLVGVRQHNAFGLPDRRVQVENLPRQHGAIELTNLWGRRTISMQGFVAGQSRSDLEDTKNALKRALAPRQKRLVIDTLSNQGRFYFATCENLTMVEEAGVNTVHLEWDAEFVCADPFAYDAQESRMPEFTAVNNGTVAINNLGDLQIAPYFKIRTTHGGAVTLTIVNTVTGERMTPAVPIASGDRLVIDVPRLSVTRNGIEIDYAGGFIHLAAGANTLRFHLSSLVSNPTVLVEVLWRHRYI